MWTVVVSATAVRSQFASHSTPATYRFAADMYTWNTPRVRKDSNAGGPAFVRSVERTIGSAVEPAESAKDPMSAYVRTRGTPSLVIVGRATAAPSANRDR